MRFMTFYAVMCFDILRLLQISIFKYSVYFIACHYSGTLVLLMQVSKSGSVKVEKLMNIERYSHVMHISSTVCIFCWKLY